MVFHRFIAEDSFSQEIFNKVIHDLKERAKEKERKRKEHKVGYFLICRKLASLFKIYSPIFELLNCHIWSYSKSAIYLTEGRHFFSLSSFLNLQ